MERQPNTGSEEKPNTQSFENLLEEYNYKAPKRGQLLQGIILRIEGDALLVDVGLKRDAIVPSRDLERINPELRNNLQIGDSVVVQVLQTPVGNNDLLVSLNKGLEYGHWLKAEKDLSEGNVLELEVIGENRGGLLVQYESLLGFLPNSLIPSLKRIRDRAHIQVAKKDMIGTTLPMKVVEVDSQRNRLILSVEAAQEEQRRKRIEELEPGQEILGQVSSIVNFGVFVDLDGVDGLVHISQLDWQRVEKPGDLFNVGDSIRVQVMEVDVERERISLSRKALLANPWTEFAQRYQAGDYVEGRVTKVLKFGAFVELEPGIDGLVHVSELGYLASDNPQDSIKPNDIVLVKILKIEPFEQRISLSMRKVPLNRQINWAMEQDEPPDACHKNEQHDRDNILEASEQKEENQSGSIT